MVKTPYSDKLQMKKGLWEEDEHEKVLTYDSNQQHGTGNWTTFSKRSGGQKRSGKSSREKWSNSNHKADPTNISFSAQEEELIIQLHATLGSRWPIIAQQFPGRTENDVKTLWNSKLRKKLSAMGIDPITHKPFSQILADYGSIGAFPRVRTRFTSLSRDLKNAIMSESGQLQRHHRPHITYSDTPAANVKTELSDPPYSQLQVVDENKAQQYFGSECAATSSPDTSLSSMANQETASSFSWSDFFLEDPFFPPQNFDEQIQCDEDPEGKRKSGEVGDEGGEIVVVNRFDQASSSSNSSSFVEAMLDSQHDQEMFSQLSCFCEEPFY